MSYTVTQWLLLFFMYSFFGWIWESCFVSARKHEWVNRGFLYGPVVPIYGFGAIIILWLTLPVRKSLPLIFLLGMIGATALEYAVGFMMEKMFHMRWWDYSDKPLNLNGYICLWCSLGWGCFSLLLTKLIHPPIEKLMLIIPDELGQILSLLCLAAIAVDTTRSVQAAMDMKELLAKLKENNARVAAAEEKLAAVSERLSQGSENLKSRMQGIEATFRAESAKKKQEREEKNQSRREYILGKLQEHRDKNSGVLAMLSDKTDAAISAVKAQIKPETPDGEKTRLGSVIEELQGFRASLGKMAAEAAARRDRDYRRAVDILQRNPSASSMENREVLGELRELGSRLRRKK